MEDDKVEMKKTILACVIICQSFFLFACAKENGKTDDMKTMIEHAEFINNQSNITKYKIHIHDRSFRSKKTS